MIRIGKFAEIFGVSIKTIRLYEEKGLLTPSSVDIFTGYRYFDDVNIKEMSKILILKDLGLSLMEIKSFDEELISSKIKEYEKLLVKTKNNINTLKSLSQSKEVLDNMKAFINDENVIGKWELIGVSPSLEKAINTQFEEDDWIFKTIYFLPEGEKYWVISWTKGKLFIGMDIECNYKIEKDTMYLEIKDLYDEDYFKVAVYKRIDSKKYNKDEILIKDNINVPFVADEKLYGSWKSVDFIDYPNKFDPNKKYWKSSLYLEKIIVSKDNECLVSYKTESNYCKKITYTKDYFINLCTEDTLSKYEHLNIDNNDYILVEWKSGDYAYGNYIQGYYVLKKLN